MIKNKDNRLERVVLICDGFLNDMYVAYVKNKDSSLGMKSGIEILEAIKKHANGGYDDRKNNNYSYE